MYAADLFVTACALYLGAGVLFAPPFLARGIERVDSSASGSSIAFRLIVTPGVVALWPILARKWLSKRGRT